MGVETLGEPNDEPDHRPKLDDAALARIDRASHVIEEALGTLTGYQEFVATVALLLGPFLHTMAENYDVSNGKMLGDILDRADEIHRIFRK